jgi:transposase
MSREAFGDPPEHQDVPECCPNCGSDLYTPGCTHCEEVKRRCAAESEALESGPS